MLLARVAEVSREVAAASARSRKTALLAALFAEAEPEESPLVIAYLSGRLPQGRIGVGWSVLKEVVPPAVPPAERPELTLGRVDEVLTELAGVSGAGSRAARTRLVHGLFAAATLDEQQLLLRLLTGEVRQGALDAIALEGVAQAATVPAAELRRAVMLEGSLPPVAQAVLAEGATALDRFTLRVGNPVQPMLAHTAGSVTEAIAALGPCVVEEKLDGIRVQIHRSGDDVRIHTRSLDDITARLPEVVAAARAVPADAFILDGEVIALDPDTGRPVSFQSIASRVGSRTDVAGAHATLPLTAVFFDVLAVEGEGLIDRPGHERHEVLARLLPDAQRVRRFVVTDPADPEQTAAAERFFADTLARGHEGVLVKATAAPYVAGRRGRTWLKVKPVHTVDLVVLAVERGHGRRTGLLSNLHLGARTAEGDFVMLGKTFKGLTDEMLRWQTERLGELAVEDDGFTVRVRPELVVEIAYDGLQRSTRYPAGVTLRFARVLRHRPDKRASEADTVAEITGRG
ncbi:MULTISPECIES: ATP-dependent DNA ligase [Streptomyces]|uniref:Probable DNA ligase n=1 Tax=Streptomyces venezuelae (strain ATCC 10712 / CBS 650.69 / DSM 40230 / JCM 4526 / NBRC 13096 / PD 04745) TaxID=953739 RepID=F2R1P4_STRVP|nr:ATP-dependent DNA ligase [Streptomyces venezuelae]APE25866.1 ATP-dependent DNA ligase [Streptomyces venezuelae]QES03201.1 ATP-dependent DNA ligase [Streptomyces venezuelae ATCC 10712]CCA60561.1 ATP-dependent DNA ligase [Streptomyces venezuelae ATCC 10712]